MGKLLLFLSLLFCPAIKVRSQPCGNYYNPKKQKFQLKKKAVHQAISELRFDGVYLYTYYDEKDSTRFIAKFYKFFEDGRIFISGDFCNVTPTKTDFINPVYGGISYFLVRQNSIKIESYGGTVTGYIYTEGRIEDPEHLLMLSYKSRNSVSRKQWFPQVRKFTFLKE